MNIKVTSIITITLSMFILVNPSNAVFENMTGKAIRDIIEYTATKFGIELTNQTGKEFAERATRFLATHGDDGARILRHGGPDVLEYVERHGDDIVKMCASHSDDAIMFLTKNADYTLPIWKKYGKEGTELILKHPGFGEKALQEFGNDAIILGNKFSSESLNKILQISSRLNTQAEKKKLFDTVLKRGDDAVEFLWRHKWKIAGGVTFYKLLKALERRINPAIENKIKNYTQGLTNYITESILDRYPWIVPAFILLIVIWLFPLIKYIWIVPRKITNK